MNKQTKVEVLERIMEDLHKLQTCGLMHRKAHNEIKNSIDSLMEARRIIRGEMGQWEMNKEWLNYG